MPLRFTSFSVTRHVRILLLAALSLGAAIAVTGCGSDSGSDSGTDPGTSGAGEVIPIGSIFSVTGDGVAFGPQQLKGARLAVREVNRDPDAMDGARFRLVQRDDRSDPAESARQMEKLIADDQVIAALGPTFSNSAAEAHPVANRMKTPVLAVSNTGPGIVGDCPYPCDFIFRDSLGEAEAIPANIANLLQSNPGIKHVEIFHPAGDPFGRTSAETARQAFDDHGVSAALSTTDADGRVTDMTDERRDAFMVTASSGAAAATSIRDLRGFAGFDIPILGGNAFNSQLAAKEAGKAGKGASSASAWFAGNDSDENREFIAAYRKAYGEEPDQFAAQAYTGVKLLAEAADDAALMFSDVAPDRKAMRDALEQVDEETPLGEFSFTADHDVRQPIWIVAMDGKGGYTLVEEVKPD